MRRGDDSYEVHAALSSAATRQHPLLRCRRPSGEGALTGNSRQSLFAYLSVDTLNDEPIIGKLERDLARRVWLKKEQIL